MFRQRLGFARGAHDSYGVVANLRGHVNVVGGRAQRLYCGGVEHGLDVDGWLGVARHDLPLLFRAGVGNHELQQEAIDLRFRKRIGPFQVDRILRRHHQEGIG